MRPVHVLLFLLAVMGGLATIGTLLPADGLHIGDAFTLRLPSAKEVLFPKVVEQVDISDILAITTDPGAVADPLAMAESLLLDSIDERRPFVFDSTKIRPLEERISLHYPKNDATVLWPLFAQLEKASSGAHAIRILHYGDSQLEGDRITAYLRNKLQVQFGGTGPGLFPIADIVASFSVDRTLVGDWQRFSVMGIKDPGRTHGRYGALSAFSRFTPIDPDTLQATPAVQEASITMRALKRAYGRAQQFTVCKLYYGWHRTPLTLELYKGDELISSEVVPPSDKLLVREWKFESTPAELNLRFRGTDSPDVFGISLQGRTGVAVDNIAARGGSGYEFQKMDQDLLSRMYSDLDVECLILQYGGNVLPEMDSAEDAAQYGRFFGAQIARFKRMIPGVSVIVIGPSDMSIKEGEYYVTRPYLEEVRDAMKANSLAQGAVFWDMYEAMGGRNSMVSWVTADPPLAATDYTHFSPQGAKKVGELFFTALINDFAAFHAARRQ